MDGIFFPMLIAAAVAMLALGVTRVVRAFLDGEKRKISERLSTDARFDPADASARAIRIQLEQDELPPLLSRLRIFNTLHRHVTQALPNTTVIRFLTVAGALAFFVGACMFLV